MHDDAEEPMDYSPLCAELRAEVERLKDRLGSVEAHYENHNSDDYGAWCREYHDALSREEVDPRG